MAIILQDISDEVRRAVGQAVARSEGRWQCLCHVQSKTGRAVLAAGMGYAGGNMMVWLNHHGRELREQIVAQRNIPPTPRDMLLNEGATFEAFFAEMWEKVPSIDIKSGIRALRTVWANRPVVRMVLSRMRWRIRCFLRETRPTFPEVNFEYKGWTDEDENRLATMWRESKYLAFWLCPDGAEAGIVAHDEYLACQLRDETKVNALDEVLQALEDLGDDALAKRTRVNTPRQKARCTTIERQAWESEVLYHLPCGCSAGVRVLDIEGFDKNGRRDTLSACHRCGSTWIPASNNPRVIASDQPHSLRRSQYRGA